MNAFGQRRLAVAKVEVPVIPDAPEPPPRASNVGPLADLRALCLARVDASTAAVMSPERLAKEVERLLSEIATELRVQLNAKEQRELAEELVHDMVGLGPLEMILDDDGITDVMVNGPDKVFIERQGKLVLSDVRFRDAAHVANICQRIAASVGRRVDESSPIVDARLKDGSRVNIVLQPLALDGPYVSIRKFAKRKIDFAQLIKYGSMTEPLAKLLQLAGSARLNVVVSGGTGSGKTTMLNALSRMIDPGERVVTVEGRGGAAIAAAARGAARDPAGEPRGPRRDHPARPGAQRPANAARPHHHRRGARAGGVRHAAGDEHRP